MKKLISFFVALFMVCLLCMAADYATKIYRAQGGDELVVADGGKIAVQSGGVVDVESGGLFKIAGTTATLTTQSNLKSQSLALGMYIQDQAVLSAAEKTVATQSATALRAGYLTFADWTTFNDKVPASRTVGGNPLSANVTNAMLKASVIAANLYSSDLLDSGTTKAGSYTVVADDDTANSKTIATGLSSIVSAQIQVLRANVVQYGETFTISAGSITIADNGEVYVLTTGDVINWIAVGGL